jgi:hypothetical protein
MNTSLGTADLDGTLMLLDRELGNAEQGAATPEDIQEIVDHVRTWCGVTSSAPQHEADAAMTSLTAKTALEERRHRLEKLGVDVG